MGMDLKPVRPNKRYPRDEDDSPKWHKPEEHVPDCNKTVYADFQLPDGIWRTATVQYNATGSAEIPNGFYYNGIKVVPAQWTYLPELPKPPKDL